MHTFPEQELPELDEHRVHELYERTIAGSGRVRRRRRTVATAAVVVVAATTALAVGLAPSGPRPSVRSGSTTWQLVADVTDQFSAKDVSFIGSTLVCPSSTTCLAFGRPDGSAASGLVLEITTDGGTSWSESSTPGTLNPTSLTCPGAATCAALSSTQAGPALVETTDAGETWATEPFPGSFTGVDPSLSCTSALDCVAIASAGDGAVTSFVTSDGGQTWASSSLPVQATATTTVEITQLSCQGRDCTVVGSTQPDPGSGVPPAPASTSSGTSSGTGGWQGFSLASSDGGATWVLGTMPSGFIPGYDFSCTSGTDCLALGNTSGPAVLATTDGGKTWTATSVPGGGAAGEFVNWDACTSSACWVSGGALSGTRNAPFLDETSDLGASWIPTSLPTGVTAIGNVACTDSSTCYALGAESDGSSTSTLVLLSNAS